MTACGITESCSSCGRPHNIPTSSQTSTKLKISLCYFVLQCLYPDKTSSSVKNILGKLFFYEFLFTHMHLVRCLSSIVNLIAVTTFWLTSGLHRIAAIKKYLRRIQVIFMLLESAFNYLFCLIFSFKLVTVCKSDARKQKCVFFWTLCRSTSRSGSNPKFNYFEEVTLGRAHDYHVFRAF